MSATDNLQIVRNVFEAFDRGDIDAILVNCAEDIEWQAENTGAGELPWGGVRHGHAGTRQWFESIAEHIEISALEQLDFLASESQVAVVMREELTIKKNGQKVTIPEIIGLWTFNAAGKVVRVSNLYDPTAFFADWRG